MPGFVIGLFERSAARRPISTALRVLVVLCLSLTAVALVPVASAEAGSSRVEADHRTGHPQAKPAVDFDIALALDALGSASATAEVTVRLLGPQTGEEITVTTRLTGTGGFDAIDLEHVTVSSRRQVIPHRFKIPSAPVGHGSIRATVTVDRLTTGPQSRARQVAVVRDDNGIWTSPHSMLHAEVKRINRLEAEGLLTAAEANVQRQELIGGSSDTADPVGPPPEEPPPNSQPSEEAAVRIPVSGTVKWTDRAGVTHGLPSATVEIRDDDTVGSQLLATVVTDGNGEYATTVTHSDGPGEGNPDLFIRVLARSAGFDIQPDLSRSETYRLESPVSPEVEGGAPVVLNATAGNDSESETAFSVHHAMAMIHGYAAELIGRSPEPLMVRYPSTESTTLLGPSKYESRALHLAVGDRWDWDVIHHEYGHHVLDLVGLLDVGSSWHRFGFNNSTTKNKNTGIRLAWAEGWSTYFAISGQQRSGAGALGIQGVGDSRYQDTDDLVLDVDIENETGVGEDDELSVAATLLDLFDDGAEPGDDIQLSDRTIHDRLTAAQARTVGQAWEAIAGPERTQRRVDIGSVFARNNIAPALTGPEGRIDPAGSAPTFSWDRNGAGAGHPLNRFRIVFYDHDFSREIMAKELGDAASYTPTVGEWAAITAGESVVKWVVEGRSVTPPGTPGLTLRRYWSGSGTIGGVDLVLAVDESRSMSDELTALRAAFAQYRSELDAQGDGIRPTVQLITFADAVTGRLLSDDLVEIQTALDGLEAHGGEDCPEAGAHALVEAARSVAPGGAIVMATDAAPRPGVDLSAVIAALRTKGATANVVLSGDCGGLIANPGHPFGSGGAGAQFPPSRSAPDSAVSTAAATAPVTETDGDPVPDLHGDTPLTASPMQADAPAIRGSIGRGGDVTDFFVLDVEIGQTVTIDLQVESGSPVAVNVLTDGSGIASGNAIVGGDAAVRFTAPWTGPHYLALTRNASSTASSYLVSARVLGELNVLQRGVEIYSAVAEGTGGAFLVRDRVNTGDQSGHRSAVLNMMMGATAPVIIGADPQSVVAGSTTTFRLTGRNTAWRPGAQLSVEGDGIEVVSTTVDSARHLTATVAVDPDAAPGRRDLTVTTPDGGRNPGGVPDNDARKSAAIGRDALRVTVPGSQPMITGVEPTQLAQDETADVMVRGLATQWTNETSVAITGGFGSSGDVIVDSVEVLSPVLLRLGLTALSDAAVGYRNVEVTTGDDRQVLTRGLFVPVLLTSSADIVTVAPGFASPGDSTEVAITAVNTDFDPVSTTISFGPGVTVEDVIVDAPTTATARVSIASDAAIGFRSVTVTTGGRTVVELDGFLVGMPTPPDVLSCGETSGTRAELEAQGYEVLIGTEGRDVLYRLGSTQPAFILAGGGADYIRTGNADDIICAGDGDDVVRSEDGDDRIDGGPGNDRIIAGGGDDVVTDPGGTNRMDGQGGDDWLRGGGGSDRMWGSAGSDRLGGLGGDDVIDGGPGPDQISGGAGDDIIRGTSGNDVLRGGRGRDSLDGQGGNDRLRDTSAGVTIFVGGPGQNTCTDRSGTVAC